MRVLIVIAILLLWVSPALAEEKAPDGFGPIKFGMTKEEAWEAIGGEGRWEEGDAVYDPEAEILIHKKGLPRFLSQDFEVKHRFVEGRAYDVTIMNPEERMVFINCVTHLAKILGIITNKFGVYPVKLDFMIDGYPSPAINHVNVYQFHYSNNSYIMATLKKS